MEHPEKQAPSFLLWMHKYFCKPQRPNEPSPMWDSYVRFPSSWFPASHRKARALWLLFLFVSMGSRWRTGKHVETVHCYILRSLPLIIISGSGHFRTGLVTAQETKPPSLQKRQLNFNLCSWFSVPTLSFLPKALPESKGFPGLQPALVNPC